MKGKRIIIIKTTAVLLSGMLVFSVPVSCEAASAFSDGTQEVLNEDPPVFQSGSDDSEHFSQELLSDGEVQELVIIDKVSYRYNQETDSYWVSAVSDVSGRTMSVQSEISGKKVTEVGSRIYDVCFEEPPEPYIVIGDLVLPNTITRIGEEAFANGGGISMEIPDSVTEIGVKAFLDCPDLRFLRISAGMGVFPEGLFENCEKLDTIEIPEGIYEIQDRAMKGCPTLRVVHIPSSVTNIGEDLFEENAQVTIYGKAGSYAETYAKEHGISFCEEGADPSQTENVVLDGIHYTYQESTDSYIVTGYDGTISSQISIAETVNEKYVTAVGDGVFSKCSRLVAVQIPGSVKTVGENAFSQCMNLETVIMESGVETLGAYVFAGCTSLKTVSLPDGITSIGARGFYYCGQLENIKLPAGLRRIETNLFEEAAVCGILEIPEGVTSIGTLAFSNFSADGILLPDTLVSIENAAFYFVRIKSLAIPDSVTEIGQNLFRASDLEFVSIGKGMRSIRSNTFTECYKLQEVILPEGVVEIGKYAFRDTAIRRISIPDSVIRIHKQAFSGSELLTLFVKAGSYGEKFAKYYKIPYETNSISAATKIVDGVRYQYDSKKKTYSVTGFTSDVPENLAVLKEINGEKVTAVQAQAFKNCEKIKSVQIPNTVTAIGDSAFEDSGITVISIPDSVQSIGERAFASCSGLNSISLPDKITVIPEQCFGNSGLTQVKLPENLEIIENRSFYGTQLKAVEIPETVTEIGEAAFGNSKLKEISIPGTVKILAESNFSYCTSLEKAVLQDGVEQLGNAFIGCKNLKELYIPDSVYLIANLDPGKNAAVYGNTGSKAEKYCAQKEITFISLGTAVLERPELTGKIVQGNNIVLGLKERCDNADFYQYVLSKSKDFPETGEMLYQVKRTAATEYQFDTLDKGNYYLYGRSVRELSDGTEEYSQWSETVKVTVSVQAPETPEIKSIKVKGTTVTVTVGEVSGTKGYGIVLADHAYIDPVQNQYEPVQLYFVSINNKSAVYTFKNTGTGSYCVLARTYTRDAKGQNVYSPWSEEKWS